MYKILNGVKYLLKTNHIDFLIYQPLLKYFKASKKTVNAMVIAWISIGLSDESIDGTNY